MRVKDLIQLLQAQDPEAEVKLESTCIADGDEDTDVKCVKCMFRYDHLVIIERGGQVLVWTPELGSEGDGIPEEDF